MSGTVDISYNFYSDHSQHGFSKLVLVFDNSSDSSDFLDVTYLPILSPNPSGPPGATCPCPYPPCGPKLALALENTGFPALLP